MWKTSWILALMLPALGAVPAPQPSAGADVLRVLVVRNDKEPEFFCLRSDCPPGFDREILEAFATSRHQHLQGVAVEGWDQLIPALNARRGDIIAGRFTYTESRARQVAFTTEAFPTRAVVVTHRTHRGPINDLATLRQERVGVLAGSSSAEEVTAAGVPPAKVDSSFTNTTLLDGLRSGKVGAIAMGVERAILVSRREPDFELGMYLGPPGRLAYAVRSGDTELLAALNTHLIAHRSSGQWSQLLVKYFGPAAPEVLRRARSVE
jgi:ABC-type amino acid transport substrate-binding protein